MQRYVLSARPVVDSPTLIPYSQGCIVLYSEALAALDEKDKLIALMQDAFRRIMDLCDSDDGDPPAEIKEICEKMLKNNP